MPTVRLTDRAVIAVGGPGAEAFLQTLVTNAVATPRAGWSTYAALLTPQGKVQFDFVIHGEAEGYLLDVAVEKTDDLLKRLKMYRLRAPVTLDARPDLAVFAAWASPTPPHPEEGALAPVPKDAPATDPRLPALGQRWIAPSDSIAPDADLAAYTLHRLTLGVPDSADVEGEFALDANFEELHGVDFRKGCFVGQEVTARMKHKAQPRKRLVPVFISGELPPAGAPIEDATGLAVGEMRSGSDRRAIASVRIERLVNTTDLVSAGLAIALTAPAYPLPALKFDAAHGSE
ncbi:tRNA-modifying protein YgfZ [Alphaproteobacteria bacterium SO-S41]|nr:tRNA-modifying protein YgfZ [Alphaproteobacteria bacterium SO-S41]